jgi:hypothetical protein
VDGAPCPSTNRHHQVRLHVEFNVKVICQTIGHIILVGGQWYERKKKTITSKNLCSHRGQNDQKVEEAFPTPKDMKLLSNLIIDLQLKCAPTLGMPLCTMFVEIIFFLASLNLLFEFHDIRLTYCQR